MVLFIPKKAICACALAAALVTLAAVFVLFKVLLQLAYVPSGSMETTIPTK